MIVLDEQLLGRGLEGPIAAWYPGKVHFIKDLRPGTVIKDDAIPMLLSQQSESTFITINESDFWQVFEPNSHYCIVCFSVKSSEVNLIPVLLQRLVRHSLFDTKAKRMGCIIRISASGIAKYYNVSNRTVRSIDDF